MVDIPQGPRKIGPKNQISIPAELLEGIGLAQGGEVFLAPNPDIPNTLLIIPAELFSGEPFWRALDVLRNRADS